MEAQRHSEEAKRWSGRFRGGSEEGTRGAGRKGRGTGKGRKEEEERSGTRACGDGELRRRKVGRGSWKKLEEAGRSGDEGLVRKSTTGGFWRKGEKGEMEEKARH